MLDDNEPLDNNLNESINELSSESTDGFVAEDALEALVMEKEVDPDASYSSISKKFIDQNSPVVVQSLLRLALHSRSERIRFDAGRYLLDRALGRVGEEKFDGTDNPTVSFVDEVTSYVKEQVNASGLNPGKEGI